jgi:hypothetical protein
MRGGTYAALAGGAHRAPPSFLVVVSGEDGVVPLPARGCVAGSGLKMLPQYW